MSRWKVLKSQELFTAGFFKMRVDECELPDGRVMPRYYVLEFPDWVNVMPLTPTGEVILVRQYRHGAGREFLEIPGGSTHPGPGSGSGPGPGSGANEDPQRAGERELLEETGYRAKTWVPCGGHFPNPALQPNRMHTYLALGCEKVAEPNLDPFEDLEVVTLPLDETLKLWREGGFAHSLIAASIGLSLKALSENGFKIF